MTSYELANQHGMYHSEILSKIMNVSKEFNNSVMKFEKKGDAFINMNSLATAFMLLLLKEG